MKTERVTVASLLFDPANVRKHGERNLDAIKASLARFGQQKPIVVDGDGIVRAGNGTLMAAKALGWDEIEIVRTNLRGSEATAYAIADNRTAELAEWDEAALAEQLAALQIDDEALAAATGFDASEIQSMALDERFGAKATDAETEIDLENKQFGCKCPRCGFEFDNAD